MRVRPQLRSAAFSAASPAWHGMPRASPIGSAPAKPEGGAQLDLRFDTGDLAIWDAEGFVTIVGCDDEC